MSYEIRVKTKNLFFEGIVPFVILLGVLIGFLPMGGPNYLLIALLCLFGIFDCLHNSLLPLLRSRFIISDEMLQVVLVREQLKYRWEEIQEVSLEESPKETHLRIVTAKGARSIALSSFDSALVWSLINEKVNKGKMPQVTRGKTGAVAKPVKSTVTTQELTGKKQEQPAAAKNILTLEDSRWVKKILWGFCLLCLIIIIISVLYVEWIAFLVILPFFLLGLFGVLNQGVTYVDSFSVTRKNRLGTYSILWKEVELVEVSPFGDGISFRGRAKRLVIPGPGWMEEKDRAAFNQKIMQLVNDYQVRLLENKVTILYRTRNCRI